MRGGILVLALMAAGSVARAQAPREQLASPDVSAEAAAAAGEPTPEPQAREPEAGPPADGEAWVLDDGVGLDEVTWDPLPTGSPLVPRGRLHFGATLRVAALPADSSPAPDGPQVELGVLLDFRIRERSPFHMRAVLSISGRPHGDRWRGAGITDSAGPLAVRLRLMPLSVHLAEWLALRVGAAVSVDWVPAPLGDTVAVGGGVDTEIVARFDDGQFEVGITGGLQLDAVGRTTRTGVEQAIAPEPMIGLVASWVAP